MDELTLAVVGTAFSNRDGTSRRFEIELCGPGDPVELRPEYRNRVDPRAVGVWRVGGGQLGYVTAERAGVDRPAAPGRARRPRSFRRSPAASPTSASASAAGAPALPAAAPVEHPGDPDFFPDPDGPEFGA